MAMRSLVIIAGLAVAAGCSEQTLVGPEAQEAFEQARARYEADSRSVLAEGKRDREATPLRIHGTPGMDPARTPLVFVNGVEIPTDGQALAGIDAADIASIHVLKGRYAFERFGARGLNGVIFITTKAGPTTD